MKTTKSLALTLVILLSTVCTVFSQGNDALRVEIEVENSSQEYHIAPLGKEGVLLFYESDESSSNGNKIWNFTKFDSNFKELWTKDFPILKNLEFFDFYYPGESSFFLLVTTGKGNKGNFQVIDLDITSGEIKLTNGKITLDAIIRNFKVVGSNVFLTGTSVPSSAQSFGQAVFSLTLIPLFTGKVLYKTNAVLINLDLNSGVSSIIKNNLEGNSYIIGAEVDFAENAFNVLFKNPPSKGKSKFYRNKYNATGELISSIVLTTEPGKDINAARTLKINSESDILIGTYQNVNPKKRRRTDSPNTSSTGMFFSAFDHQQQQYVKYYDFSRFSTYFKYLKKGLFSSGERAVGHESKQLLVHDILKREQDYVMVAECYYPQYHTEYRASYRNGQMMTYPVQVFDGYRYTHAIVAGFDGEGNLIWDNAFEIGDVLSYDLKERVKVLASKDEIVLLYSWDGNIASTVIRGEEVTGSKEKTKIESENTDEKVKRNYENDIMYWYDSFFISYGYQTLTKGEKNKGKKKNKTIFYFNKIGYSG